MSVAGLAQRYRAAIFLATTFVTLSGIYALGTLPAGIYPEVTYPRIVVVAQSPAFEPDEMTVAVTRPVEETMTGLIGLQRIRSRTVRGATEISLDFSPNADMWLALQQVQGRLAALRLSLPPDIEVVADRLTTSIFPVLQYELTGADPIVLRDVAQYAIRPVLTRAPDVGQIEVQGGDLREITVSLDPEKLILNRLAATDVQSAIAGANVVGTAGHVDERYRQYVIIVSDLVTTPQAVGSVVVRRLGDRPVRVGDLGTVTYGRADKYQLFRGDGKPAALINVSRQPSGNILRLEASVRAVLDSVRPTLPKGVELRTVYDQAALVRESLAGVRDAILVGGGLAVIVLLVFLGDLRLTLAAALTLPLALAGALAGIKLTGGSLNLMSLGGLAVAIGLIIDDAVVVVENIERRLALHPEEPVADVIRRGTDEIFGPVLSSTITTVVVFAPLGLVEGVVGQFFRAFSIALAIAVGLSLILAVTLIPLVAERWLAVPRKKAELWRLSLAGVERWYRRTLEMLLARKRLALALAGALVLLAYGGSRVVGSGFLPEMDEGGFILDYWAPTESSLRETDREVKLIESILQDDPDIQAFSRRTGTELGFAATSPNRGDITALLKPRRQRHGSVYDVMDRVRARLETEVPAVRVEFVQLMQDVIGDLAGAPSPIEIKLFTANQGVGATVGREVARTIASVPGLVDLYDGVAGENVETRVRADPVRTSRLGITPADVVTQAQLSLYGGTAGHAREPDRLIPIRVHLKDSVRYAPSIASSLPIIGPNGWAPLAALGTSRDTSVASELLREDLRPLIKVTGRVSGSNLGTVMAGIKHAMRSVSVPPGVRLEYGGQYVSQRQSFRELLLVFCLAVAAVLTVLVIQFRTLRGPLGLVIAAPLGLTGAVLGLALVGVPFNVSSFMGLILLIGLVVKNGILLLDAAQHYRSQRRSVPEALIEAGVVRMRPIVMTTLCTLAGLFPLALGWGAGAELQRPLAIAVIGGLSLSTLVTLLLLPVGLAAMGALEPGVE